MPLPPQRARAIQMLVLCTAMWALSFPLMKALPLAQQDLVPSADSWFSSALCVVYRFGMAALVMLVVCGRSLRNLTRRELAQGLGMGLSGGGGILLQMDGLAHTEASTSAFLTQCYCLFIPIWVALYHRRRPAPKVIVSCVLVMAGVAILAQVDWRDLRLGRGEFETLLASVFFTGQILWLERPRYAGNDVNRFSAVMFGVMAVMCVPLAVGTTRHPADWILAYGTPATLGMLGLLVFVSTLGGYLLMNYWQRHVTATEAGLIYCCEPIFASTLALFLPGWLSRGIGITYLNETVGTNLLIGGGLITVANVLLQLPGRAANRKPGWRSDKARND